MVHSRCSYCASAKLLAVDAASAGVLSQLMSCPCATPVFEASNLFHVYLCTGQVGLDTQGHIHGRQGSEMDGTGAALKSTKVPKETAKY